VHRYGKNVRRGGSLWLTVVCVPVLLLVAACGTLHAPNGAPAAGASSATEESKSPLPPICPQAAAVVAAGPCVSVGVQQQQQANQSFNSRIPLSAQGVAEAAPITLRIKESLARLTKAQRLQGPAVRSALLAGGMQSTDLVVLAGPPYNSVTFGGYEVLDTRPPVCAWGTLTAKGIEVDTGGITREGACLPDAGGH
jgi:hypothetical protein